MDLNSCFPRTQFSKILKSFVNNSLLVIKKLASFPLLIVPHIESIPSHFAGSSVKAYKIFSFLAPLNKLS